MKIKNIKHGIATFTNDWFVTSDTLVRMYNELEDAEIISNDEKAYLNDVVDSHGRKQLIIAIEELSELQKELCKILREKGDDAHVSEEMADCHICLYELMHYFDNKDAVKEWVGQKVERLMARIQNGEE